MKRFIMICLLISGPANAFSVIDGQKLPQNITYTCPDEVSDWIANGFSQWNAACDGMFTITRVDHDATVVIETSSTLPPGLAGICYSYGDKAKIVFLTPYQVAYHVATHELGHAFGLGHSDDPLSVMQPTGSLWELCQDDVDGIRTIYGLSRKVLDFKVQVKRGLVVVSGNDKYEKFVFSDSFANIGRRVKHKMPRGVYSILCYTNRFVIKKEVVVE